MAEFSSRITPRKVSHLLAGWHTQLVGETIHAGESFNLDFHSVPYFGEHPLVESHYLSKRSRRQPSILTFLAQDPDAQVFCYANADVRKGEEAEEIFRFINFWRRQFGKQPLRQCHRETALARRLCCHDRPQTSPACRAVG